MNGTHQIPWLVLAMVICTVLGVLRYPIGNPGSRASIILIAAGVGLVVTLAVGIALSSAKGL